MNLTVARTCSELDSDGDRDIILSEPKPLSAFRQAQAYVLLGDAGSGKTTEFQQESEALGDSAEYLSARQFTRSDVDSHPEWRGKILFIDGLDEMRAGKTDSLTPLDQIITQLARLGPPNFRLSCREADWLGTNDRQNLATVSPDSQITVLRLNPLDDDGIRALLTSLDLPGDVGEFIDQARRRGLGAILHNPQTLVLLAEAVGQGGEWPNSRQETFEMACHKMATERNNEHLHRTERLPSEAIMDAAGYLCAAQLLVGIEGFSLEPIGDDPSFVRVDDLLETGAQPPRVDLGRTLTTRLFIGVDQQRVRPVHRHIAEFLAGRHLAKLIESGLPVERAIALMTSPSDHRVVTVLRGLSAWLAAHSPSARRRLIDLDPVGVGLYGDIKGLPLDEKRQILESLAAFAQQGPLFGHERADDHGSSYIRSTTQAFRSLVTADMIPAITDLLAGPATEARDYRMTEFILGVLCDAEEASLESLSILTADLQAILHDPATPSHVKDLALDAFMHIAPSNGSVECTLLDLLQKIRDGALPDSHGQLRGTLLSSLYPSVLDPSEVWQFALPLNPGDYRMSRFLDEDLLKKSSGQQVTELLDALYEDASTHISALENAWLEDLLVRLLVRGLEESGEQTELPRLYNWLSLIGDFLDGLRWKEDELREIQNWLESKPHIQKAVFLTWLRQSYTGGSSEPYPWVECDVLLESTLPADFGLWCLDNALELADTEPSVAQNLLTRSHRSLKDPSISEGLSLDVLRSRTRVHDGFKERLEELCTPRLPDPELSESQQRLQARITEREEERREQQAQRVAALRSRVSDLRENRLFPRGLHDLAQVYFGKPGRSNAEIPPDQRISEFVGGDPDLVGAVMVALRGAVWRDDVPGAEETISLDLDSKFSLLAFPVLASLDLLYREDPALLDELDDTLKRKILAIHFCVSAVLESNVNRSTPWFERLLEHDIELVLEVLFRCAQAAMRAGEQYPSGLRDLDKIEDTYPALAHQLTARLLMSLPVRARQAQMPLLDRLLYRLLKAGEPELNKLVEDKLAMRSLNIAQEIRWLMIGALLMPEQYLTAFEEFTGKNQQRVRHLAEFLCNRFHKYWSEESPLVTNLSPELIATLIRLIGSVYSPMDITGKGVITVTPDLDASDRLEDLIRRLSTKSSYEAHQALAGLIDNPLLAEWRERLVWAQERQRVLLRDATYSHPGVEQVQRTLDNGLPANAADLAALLNDHLSGISENIQGSNSNIWRQFWNEEPELKAKDEEACRDALLAMLQARLPSEIVKARESHYVSAKRADIGVSYGGFNVPIEIKMDSNRQLWSALQGQLVKKYSSTDRATSGHGIYLVFWTGSDKIKRGRDGNRPTTPDELRELLEGDLTPVQTSKISVRVLDVTKP